VHFHRKQNKIFSYRAESHLLSVAVGRKLSRRGCYVTQ